MKIGTSVLIVMECLWQDAFTIVVTSGDSGDSSLVPDKNLDIKKSKLWTKSGIVPMMDISGGDNSDCEIDCVANFKTKTLDCPCEVSVLNLSRFYYLSDF